MSREEFSLPYHIFKQRNPKKEEKLNVPIRMIKDTIWWAHISHWSSWTWTPVLLSVQCPANTHLEFTQHGTWVGVPAAVTACPSPSSCQKSEWINRWEVSLNLSLLFLLLLFLCVCVYIRVCVCVCVCAHTNGCLCVPNTGYKKMLTHVL